MPLSLFRTPSYKRRGAACLSVAVAMALAGTAAQSASAEAPAGASGTTYYVDAVNGHDGNAGTSAAAAWRSLGKVNAFAFRPGDTVSFRRGQSWTGRLVVSRSGTATSPLSVTAHGDGARPVIGGGAVECVLLIGSYVRVSGLRATGCAWAGFEIRGDHNLLDSVRADKNVAGVVITEGASFNTVRAGELVDNNEMSVNDPGGENDSGAFGILLNGDDNTITGNTITGSFATSYDYGYDGAAIEVYNGDRNRIEYNTTRDNLVFTELGHDEGATADGNTYAYNVVTSVRDAGAFLVTRGAGVGTGPVRGTTAVNNSVHLPGERSDGWVCYAGCAPGVLKLRNNIVSVGGTVGYEDGEGADEDNSVYWGPDVRFDPGPASVTADPLFTGEGDLRLQPGSPALGRGVPVGYTRDIAGAAVPATAPDAGAYQH
ncbi:hypothetical protein ACFSJS_16825 [Streptomyces desertarenae]|uniref:Right-handed parallel beta-helix repeat-containing protein n=1 Tax=Streptomyces desertarenae TaxID=2666184 RepID=A0ABW4PKP0_9ACTN